MHSNEQKVCLRNGVQITNVKRDRVSAKKRSERRLEKLIEAYSSAGEKNCKRFIKRLNREKGMLFTFLEDEGILPQAALRSQEEGEQLCEINQEETRHGKLLLQGKPHSDRRWSGDKTAQVLQGK